VGRTHTPQAQRALQRLCDVKVAAEVSRTKRRARQHLLRVTDDVAGRFNRLRCRQQTPSVLACVFAAAPSFF
jgi:hypothetical protein